MVSGSRQPVRLFTFGTGWGIPFPTAAPFPLKLATWLRMTGLEHEIVIENNPGKGPKKKSPWIEDGEVRMGDSELIIRYLSQKHGVDPDRGLAPLERALSVAWRRTFEEHYHQAFEHQLFFGRGGAERLRQLASTMPPVVRTIAPPIMLRQFKRQLWARGLGRHDEADLIAMGQADLDAASVFLGDRPYFLGDEPTGIDACIFGFLGVTIYVEGDNPLFRHAASLPNLVAYTERMRARYFPETLGKETAARR
jgi:glutathione S-transferase